MGLFSRTADTSSFPWKELNSTAQLDDILANAGNRTILFFKHSTRCSISAMALRGFQQEWPQEQPVELYFIDLLAHRDVSNALSEQTGVVHQSPQVIVLRSGEVVYHASHHSINAEKILQKLELP